MSANRYLLGSKGRVDFAIESTAYTQETTGFEEFGFTSDEIEPPNENPQTPMPTGGVDGPYVNSPDQRTHEIDASITPTNGNPPLETVLGDRTESAVDSDSDGTDDYTEILFTESRPVETMTVRHVQEDADLVAYYPGAKSNLDVSGSQDEPISIDLSITAARQEYDSTESAPSLTSSLPTDVTPYRFHQTGTVKMTDPSDDSTIKEVATVTGFDLSWDNGLEANHHGLADGSGDYGREAYSVSEETNADRYDMGIDIKVTDTDLYQRAAEDDIPVDVEIPVVREENSNGTVIDGMFFRLFDATVSDAPLPNPEEGSIDATISLMPTGTEIEIREPL